MLCSLPILAIAAVITSVSATIQDAGQCCFKDLYTCSKFHAHGCVQIKVDLGFSKTISYPQCVLQTPWCDQICGGLGYTYQKAFSKDTQCICNTLDASKPQWFGRCPAPPVRHAPYPFPFPDPRPRPTPKPDPFIQPAPPLPEPFLPPFPQPLPNPPEWPSIRGTKCDSTFLDMCKYQGAWGCVMADAGYCVDQTKECDAACGGSGFAYEKHNVPDGICVCSYEDASQAADFPFN